MIGINCGDPVRPTNGSVTYDDSFVGSIATYQCDLRFKLKGTEKQTCQESGTWNGTVPRCERKYVMLCTVLQARFKIFAQVAK